MILRDFTRIDTIRRNLATSELKIELNILMICRCTMWCRSSIVTTLTFITFALTSSPLLKLSTTLHSTTFGRLSFARAACAYLRMQISTNSPENEPVSLKKPGMCSPRIRGPTYRNCQACPALRRKLHMLLGPMKVAHVQCRR